MSKLVWYKHFSCCYKYNVVLNLVQIKELLTSCKTSQLSVCAYNAGTQTSPRSISTSSVLFKHKIQAHLWSLVKKSQVSTYAYFRSFILHYKLILFVFKLIFHIKEAFLLNQKLSGGHFSVTFFVNLLYSISFLVLRVIIWRGNSMINLQVSLIDFLHYFHRQNWQHLC